MGAQTSGQPRHEQRPGIGSGLGMPSVETLSHPICSAGTDMNRSSWRRRGQGRHMQLPWLCWPSTRAEGQMQDGALRRAQTGREGLPPRRWARLMARTGRLHLLQLRRRRRREWRRRHTGRQLPRTSAGACRRLCRLLHRELRRRLTGCGRPSRAAGEYLQHHLSLLIHERPLKRFRHFTTAEDRDVDAVVGIVERAEIDFALSSFDIVFEPVGGSQSLVSYPALSVTPPLRLVSYPTAAPHYPTLSHLNYLQHASLCHRLSALPGVGTLNPRVRVSGSAAAARIPQLDVRNRDESFVHEEEHL